MKNSIIPYVIIKSLSQLENIHEVRLFGWVLAKAQSVLKLYNKDLGDINMQHALDMQRVTMPARYLLQTGDTNYKNISKAFSLAKKTIEYEREDRRYNLNIIAFPEYVKKGAHSYVTFVIHNELWHALLDFSKGYRIVSLPTYMKLKSTYSVIMYILCSQQREPITYHIETLKKTLGADTQKAYVRNANFFAKVLDAAKRELDDCSQYTFEYTANRAGRGGAYTMVTIIPTINKKAQRPKEDAKTKHLEQQRVRLSQNVSDYLLYSFGMSPTEQENVERMIEQLGNEERQIQFLATIKEAACTRRVANPAGYLVQSLRNIK